LEENKAIPHRIFNEVYNQKKVRLIDDLYHKEFKSTTPPDVINGIDDHKKFVSMILNAFPDIEFKIEDQIAEGDKVVTRFTFTGTHKGEFMGAAPSNKQVSGTGITIHRIADGKAIESWDNFDALGIMQQIGAISLPGKK
jgi:steroid delta-isomerase-like uncharacterized protein